MAFEGPSLELLQAAVEENRAASEALGRFLKENRRNASDVVQRLRSGTSVTEALQLETVAARRDSYREHLAAFEATRQKLRMLLLRWAVAHGESASRVAPGLGISRQMAARIVQEARFDEKS